MFYFQPLNKVIQIQKKKKIIPLAARLLIKPYNIARTTLNIDISSSSVFIHFFLLWIFW